MFECARVYVCERRERVKEKIEGRGAACARVCACEIFSIPNLSLPAHHLFLPKIQTTDAAKAKLEESPRASTLVIVREFGVCVDVPRIG
jgi:hypothetical protein